MDDIHLGHLAAEAVEELVASYTVGIVGQGSHGPGTAIGTGFAVEWRRQVMILTASHVIRDTPPALLRFFFRPAGSLEREDVAHGSAGVRFALAEQVDIQAIWNNKAEDVAAILPDRHFRTRFNVQVYLLDPVDTMLSPGARVMLVGYPSALKEEVHPGVLAANPATMYERIVACPRTDSLDPDRHMALKYTFGGRLAPSGVHPQGFSGSGVWLCTQQDNLIWSPKVTLAGMVACYYPRLRILAGPNAITVSRVLEALARSADQ